MALALLDIEFERNYNPDLVYGRGRIFRDRRNPLEDLSPELFKYRYRLTKEVVQDLCVLLNDDFERGRNRSQALSVSIQILVTIRYLATGSFQQVSADVHGIHRTIVCKTIHKVTQALCRHSKTFIKFTIRHIDQLPVKEGFY